MKHLPKYFEYAITAALLVLAAVFKSPAFAYATVLSTLANMLREAVTDKLFAMKNIHLVVPEELRKKVQETEARISSLEYYLKQRGV